MCQRKQTHSLWVIFRAKSGRKIRSYDLKQNNKLPARQANMRFHGRHLLAYWELGESGNFAEKHSCAMRIQKEFVPILDLFVIIRIEIS